VTASRQGAYRRIASTVALLGMLLAPERATASGDERASAPLWSELGRPREQRARQLLRSARAHEQEAHRTFPGDYRAVCGRALEGLNASDSLAGVRGRGRALRALAHQAFRRRALLDAALARIDRALALAPDDGDALYARARVLAQWEQPGPVWTCSSQRRDPEAIAAFEALQIRHPELAPATVAFELAVALTRSQRFADAAQAYERAAALALDGENGATVRSNLAEMTMLAGDLQGAVDHYERALRSSNGGRDYLLALWGLSVALDRLGEHTAAIQHAQKALHAEGWTAQALRSDGVFFEPPHELHYYEGLAHEALADHDPTARTRELRAASVSYRAFLAGAGDHSTFTQAAETALSRVQSALTAASKRSTTAKR
jgi:tetratricopeptide (TPR) repeat protein